MLTMVTAAEDRVPSWSSPDLGTGQGAESMGPIEKI